MAHRGLAHDGFLALHRSAVAETTDAPPRRRSSMAAPKDVLGARRRTAPSRRFAALRMAPSTFLWLIGGWMAGLAILGALVLVLRSLA
jgi:hypothetical protein